MTAHSNPTVSGEGLAKLIDVLSTRAQAGELLELEALKAEFPEHATELERLLPAVAVLADLSRNGMFPITGVSPSAEPLGDYRLIREVGRGGMGVVYEATQISLNRRVALKVLPFAATMDSKQLQRFRNEAMAAASLRHENIVHVYGVGCERSVHFYAMELIDGQSLAHIIAALHHRPAADNRTAEFEPADAGTPTAPIGALSTELSAAKGQALYRTAARLIADAAGALEHAHSLGIVHRDIKPANLMVDADGKVFVTDFGLARFGPDADLTMSGDLLGTLRYMSPEQAMARHGLVDHRTDIYSLGATLYELLVGRPAVVGEDKQEILKHIAFEEPIAPRNIERAIPVELETITLKAMAKNPAERYGSAKEFGHDLRLWLDDKPIKARRPSIVDRTSKWATRHRALVAMTMSFLIVATAGLAVGLLFLNNVNRKLVEQRQRADVAAADAQELAIKEEKALREASASRDSLRQGLIRQHVAAGSMFLESQQRARGIWSYARAWELEPPEVDAEAVTNHRLRIGFGLDADPELVGICLHRHPVLEAKVDPAGHRLLTRTDESRAYLWDPFTSRLSCPPLEHSGQVTALDFDPSGESAATGCLDGQLRIWNARSGEMVRAFPQESPINSIAYRSDGNLIAVALENGKVRFWRPKTGESGAADLTLKAAVYHIAFSPDGDSVLTADASNYAQVWEVSTGKALTKPLPHQDRRSMSNFAFIIRCWPVFSPDGKSVATISPNGATKSVPHIWNVSSGTERFNIEARPIYAHAVTFSPNGAELLVNSGVTTNLINANQGTVLRQFNHPRETPHACFRPDGKTLATCSTGGQIHLWNPHNGSEIFQSVRCADGVNSLMFSKDGRLLVTASHDGTARVWRLESPNRARPYAGDCGHANRVLNESPGQHGKFRFSPDGRKKLVWGKSGISLVEKSNPRAEVQFNISQPLLSAWFSSDGRRVFTYDDQRTVRTWDSSTGAAIAPPFVLTSPLFHYDGSNDGRRLLTIEQTTSASGRFASRDADDDSRLKADSGLSSQAAQRIVTVWDVDKGQAVFGPLHKWDSGPHQFGNPKLLHQINRASISGDGKRLVIGSDATGALGVFDVDNGRELARSYGYRGYLYGIKFSDDDQHFLTYGSDTIARLWRTETCQPAGPPLRHTRFVRNAGIGPDGWRVATVDSSLTMRVWDGRHGELLARLELPMQFNTGIWFSSDGRRLVYDKATKIMDIPSYHGTIADLYELLPLVTGLQKTQDDLVEPVDPLIFINDPDRYRRAWLTWRGLKDNIPSQSALR